MYNFDDIGENELTPENILKRVPDAVLWRYYIGNFKLGATIRAPHRNDEIASFSLFWSYKFNKIIGKDFGTGWFGDIFEYLELTKRTDFYGALRTVNADFNLGLRTGEAPLVITEPKIPLKEVRELEKFGEVFQSSTKLLQVNFRIYTEEDLQYWASFGIGPKTLRIYDVKAINKLYIQGRLEYTHDKNDPGYSYYFPRTKHFKCYFPKRRTMRFLGNVNNFEDIQGYYQCDVKGEGDLLILTKSMKDVMCLREMGYDAMAIHGENHKFNHDFVRHIRKYYKHVVSLYDRDKSGVTGANYLRTEHGIPGFFINKRYGTKDISDMFRKYGKETVEEFLQTIRQFINKQIKQEKRCVQ